jgi:hypothetical protein
MEISSSPMGLTTTTTTSAISGWRRISRARRPCRARREDEGERGSSPHGWTFVERGMAVGWVLLLSPDEMIDNNMRSETRKKWTTFDIVNTDHPLPRPPLPSPTHRGPPNHRMGRAHGWFIHGGEMVSLLPPLTVDSRQRASSESQKSGGGGPPHPPSDRPPARPRCFSVCP